MIEPLVKEPEWLSVLATLPLWEPTRAPMLIVAPHPDDETLGAGGLIAAQRARAIDIVVAAVTDGERAYAHQDLAALRRPEQTAALARLGVPSEKIIRFGLPDGDVTSHQQTLLEHLKPLITKDTHVIAPWVNDFHPDHTACGRAAEQLAREAGATLTFYFFWTWHFGTLDILQSLRCGRFLLSPALLDAKTEALRCHRTQLFRESGEPVLPASLLWPARHPFEVFAEA